MVAVFTGLGAGFERSSAAQIGFAGLLGGGVQGRGGDRISVNAATGNLLINRQDEFLVGRGPDLGISRTYNSLGALDENGDHWRQSTDRRVKDLVGIAGTDGSQITRVSADGSEINYTFSSGAYRTTEGAGTHDTITYANDTDQWIWTDGDTGIKEIYNGADSYITEQIDQDGNTLSYSYTGTKLTRITTADGGYTDYTWSGNNITSIKTTYKDSAGATQTLTRTHYAYDASHRLEKVTTDLSPEDNTPTGDIYETNYTYHGSTKLVHFITQTDGSEVEFGYDNSGRITSIKHTVVSGNIRETEIGYDDYVTSVTSPSGAITKLYYDNKGQLLQVVAPPAEVGAKAQVIQYDYDGAGNLLRTINTDTENVDVNVTFETQAEANLIDAQDWGGGQDALRGANLIDDSGWPQDIDDVPSGPATVAGWGGGAYASEATWTSTLGPYSENVVSLHAGQLDSDNIGGGALTHDFEIDGTQDYEFTYYFKADELNKHRIYFGLSRNGVVKDGTTGNVQNNPYFTYDFANANTGIEAGKWYKLVGYVLSQGSGTASVGSYGGVYSVEDGAKVRDIKHFVWNENRTSNDSYSRFFNVYNPENQGQFTHFYKPEVREVGSANILQGSAALDVVRDRALVETPRVDEWQNTTKFVADGEARWTETDGPNGGRSVVLEAGQFDQGNSGGGNQTNNFTIDGSKTYKFTQYFRKSDLSKHWIYFGLKADADAVEYAHNGSANTNPYFMSMNDDIQRDTLIEDRWYKVEGYVLAENSANQTYGTLGGIYDTVTGEKVYDTHTFRWNENRSPDTTTSYARFFTFYDEFEHGWSTQWSAPEVIKVSEGEFPYDENGEITQFAYDGRGNVLTATNVLGQVTTYSYDANNNLTRVQYKGSYDSSSDGWMYSHNVYDSENHLRYSISAEGHVTEFEYDTSGGHTYTKTYSGKAYSIVAVSPDLVQMNAWVAGLSASEKTQINITRHLLNTKDQAERTITYGTATNTGYQAISDGYTDSYYSYDSAGRLLTSRTVGVNTQTFAYDGLGRQISTTDSDGGLTTIAFNDAATTTTITNSINGVTVSTYNKAGDLLSATNSGAFHNAGTSSYKYDALGRVRVTTDATGVDSYVIYDQAGNMTASINDFGHITEYRYDINGRVIATVNYTATDGLSAAEKTALADPDNTLTVADIRPTAHSYDIWSWTAYDAKGQVTRTALGDGSITTYAYDNAGRLTQTKTYYNKLSATQLTALRGGAKLSAQALPAVNGKDAVIKTFYNRDGQVIGSLNAEGYLTEITYDEAGRQVKSTGYTSKPTSGTTFAQLLVNTPKNAAKDITTRSVYNGQGDLRFSIDALGKVTEYFYGVNSAAFGPVRSTVQHTETLSLGSGATYDLTTVKAAVASLGSISTNRTSWAVYNTAGRAVYTIDASGAVSHLKYDTLGNVTKVTQFAKMRPTPSLPTEGTMNSWAANSVNKADARITRNYYSAQGQLRFTVDAEGYVTQTNYDNAGRVYDTYSWSGAVAPTDSWTTANVNNAAKGTSVRTMAYRYDAAGRISSTYDANSNKSHTVYRANGEVEWQIRAHGQGRDESRVLHVNDAAGRLKHEFEYSDGSSGPRNQTNYTYDGLGNLTQVLETVGTHSSSTVNQTFNTPNQITNFTYDKRGNVLTQTNAEGGITSFEYNAFGQVTKTIDPRNNVSYNYYNEAGQLTASVDTENYATQTTYTVFGEVKTVTRRYLPAQVIPSFSIDTNELDNKTTYSYDKLGQVTRVTDALGGYEQYTYDAFGQQASVRNKLGGYTYYTYDKRGQMTQSRVVADVYNSAGTKVSPNITNQYHYDSRGNQTKMVEAVNRPAAEQRTTIYVYDNADQLIEKRGDAVDVYSSGTDDSAQTETPTEYYTYDRRGNLIESENANGARTLYFYDRMDRVTHQLSPEGTLVRNFYDANSNLMETRVYESKLEISDIDVLGDPPNDPAGNDYRLTTFAYDRLNRMTDSYVHNVQTAKLGADFRVTRADNVLHTHYEYDANGNVTKVIDPNGGQTRSEYDKLNRKTRQYDSENFRTDWAYNANDNVTKETRFGTGGDAHRITEFRYNKNGQRILEVRRNVLVFDGTTQALYNVSGVNQDYANTDLTKLNGDSAITYEYNALGQVLTKREATSDEISYVYDKTGRVTNEIRTSFNDHTGQAVTPRVEYFYNGLNELSRSRNYGQNGASNAYTKFEYETGGRLLSKTDAEGFTRTYRYDKAGQVVREEYVREGKNEAIGYSYDLEGRVISQGALAKPGSSWSRSGLTNIQSQYNAFGEVSQRGTNGVYAEKFDYDNAGRLWRTTSGDGAYKYFMYDNNGNQTVSVTSDGTNIDNKSIEQILALWNVSGSDGNNNNIMDYSDRVRTNYADGVNATLTTYDARNLATQVLEPQRELTSTTGSRVSLETFRSYNAFGDVASETDARGNTIDYTYNTMGRRIKVESPEVEIANLSNPNEPDLIRPTEHYYYDISGRLVASRDANQSRQTPTTSNLTQQTLLAGTGYNGTEALITQTIAADGGRTTTAYDIQGNAREITSQLGHNGSGVAVEGLGYTTYQSFDRMGRVKQIQHVSGLTDEIRYDGLGQQTQQWNNQADYAGTIFSSTGPDLPTSKVAGSSFVATTDYDAEGRVVSQTARGGDTTTYAHDWTGTGWEITTGYANNKTSIEHKDVFGRVTSAEDMSGTQHIPGEITNFNYNAGGQLISETVGATTTKSYLWYNTGKLAQQNQTDGNKVAAFQYDAAGNLIDETLTLGGTTYRNAEASYDALGRMTAWTDYGTSDAEIVPDANMTFEYDANSNIRHTVKTYQSIDDENNQTTVSNENYWFTYDSMNRVVIDRGSLVGAEIKLDDISGKGTLYGYDQAGQRKFAIQEFRDVVSIATGDYEYECDDHGCQQVEIYQDVYFQNQHRENYTYDNAGRLTQVTIAEGTPTIDETNIAVTGVTLPTQNDGYKAAEYGYDLMGRQTSLKNFHLSDSVNPRLHTQTHYNAKGQELRRYTSKVSGSDTDITDSWFTYRGESVSFNHGGNYYYINDATASDDNYALGQVTLSWTWSYELGDGANGNVSETNYDYNWGNGAELYQTKHIADTRQPNSYDTTTHYRDSHGVLKQAYIGDGLPRWVSYKTDINGQVITRNETVTGKLDPKEIRYRFGGKEMGFTGNNGNVENQRYRESIYDQQTTPNSSQYNGAFRHRRNYGPSAADFDNSPERLNAYNQGSASGTYTVQGGETLYGIASSLYGDGNLWYKIAQVNGIQGANQPLVQGQSLQLPAGVTRNSYNASTIKAYDPSAAIGDTSPTTPEPPAAQSANKKGGCGVLGQILLVVIAVAVTVVTAGAAAAILAPAATGGTIAGGISALAAGSVGLGASIAAGVVGGAVGSIASQGFGVATGIQEKFSWKGVALAALGGGVSGGIASSGVFSSLGTFGSAAIGGATSSAVTQGIGVVTGLQDSFSWASVAAAGIGAGVLASVSANLPGSAYVNEAGTRVAATFGNQLVSGAAGAIANAATRSALDGSSFGDNILAAIPDVIGGAIGNLIGQSFAAPDVNVPPTVIDPNIGPVSVGDASVRLRRGQYLPVPELSGDYGTEVVTTSRFAPNATWDDVVSATVAGSLAATRALQSGRNLQSVDQSYRLGVSRHNASQDAFNFQIKTAQSKFNILQSDFESIRLNNRGTVAASIIEDLQGIPFERLTDPKFQGDPRVQKALDTIAFAKNYIKGANVINGRVSNSQAKVINYLHDGIIDAAKRSPAVRQQVMSVALYSNSDFFEAQPKTYNTLSRRALKVLGPVEKILQAKQSYDKANFRLERGDDEVLVVTEEAGELIGTIGGAIIGAKIGAGGGAFVGSVIPGAGTAVGAGVGGFIGGVGGSLAFSPVGRWVGHQVGSGLNAFNDYLNTPYTGYWK